MANGKKEMHRQEDMIDTLDHRHAYGKIYCPHCKHESPDYHDNCIHCGEDVGYQLGSMETSDKPGWISRDAGNLTSDDDEAMLQDAIRFADKKASLDVTFENAWGIMKGVKRLNTDTKVPMPCPECRGSMEHQDGYVGSSGRYVEPAYMCMDPKTSYCEARRHDVKSSLN